MFKNSKWFSWKQESTKLELLLFHDRFESKWFNKWRAIQMRHKMAPPFRCNKIRTKVCTHGLILRDRGTGSVIDSTTYWPEKKNGALFKWSKRWRHRANVFSARWFYSSSRYLLVRIPLGREVNEISASQPKWDFCFLVFWFLFSWCRFGRCGRYPHRIAKWEKMHFPRSPAPKFPHLFLIA